MLYACDMRKRLGAAIALALISYWIPYLPQDWRIGLVCAFGAFSIVEVGFYFFDKRSVILRPLFGNPWGIRIVLTLFGFLIGFSGDKALRRILSVAIKIDPNTKDISVKDPYAWVALGVLLLIPLLFLFMWQKVREGKEERRKLLDAASVPHEHFPIVRDHFEKMMQSALQITAQMYPEDHLPLKNVVRVRRTYLVSENFDTAVTREDDYKGLTDLCFIRILVAAEPDAEPCAFLADLNFNVQDARGPGHVAHLPTKDAHFEKEVAIFFLPHIRPDEPNPRRIIVTYKWPKMMRQLETKGFEIGDWTLESQENIPEAEFRAFFAPSLRRRLKASIAGKRIKGESLVDAVCDLPGYGDWEGWVYALRDAPPATYQIKFQMQK